MTGYNKQEAKKLIETAERSIRIVRGLLEGKTPQDLWLQEGADKRTLILYYQKKLSK